SAGSQQAQAEAALTNGARVLVVDPVDPGAAAAIVDRAAAQKVPVIAYERLIRSSSNLDYYVSYDPGAGAAAEAAALLEALKAKPNPVVVVLNGPASDGAAAAMKAAAHTVLDGKVTLAGEFDVSDWNPD